MPGYEDLPKPSPGATREYVAEKLGGVDSKSPNLTSEAVIGGGLFKRSTIVLAKSLITKHHEKLFLNILLFVS